MLARCELVNDIGKEEHASCNAKVACVGICIQDANSREVQFWVVIFAVH